MRVLFVSPNSRKMASVKEIPLVTPPLNLMYLAEVIIRNGYEARIVDAYALNLKFKDILTTIKRYNPDVLFFPLYSTDLAYIYKLTQIIKIRDPDTPIVVGGHHASWMPHEVLEEFQQVDYVIRGEAEAIVTKLTDFIKKNKGLEKIKGISYRHKGKIIHNKDALPIIDLDKIPIPSRDLIDPKNYYSRLSKRNPLGVIMTSRGCPFQCSFCPKLNTHFQKYKMRSPENVVAEIKEIVDHGAKSIEIYDDLFVYDVKRCFRILDLIKQEKMDFEFRIRTRVNFINKELLSRLKSAGCSTISYGVESGNQRILDMNRKGTKLDIIERVFRQTHKLSINILGFFLIGFPEDTPTTIRQTINFAKKLNPKYAAFGRITPYPGTKIYIEAKKNKTLVGDFSAHNPIPWVKLSWTHNRNDLDKYVDLAYKKYYYRPTFISKYIFSNLKEGNWNQLAYLAKTAFRNIKNVDLA